MLRCSLVSTIYKLIYSDTNVFCFCLRLHQGEDKLDQMVLVRNVQIMRSSSVTFVGDNLVLHQAILLKMVNVLNALDTKKLVENLVYQKDAIKV